MKGGQQEENKGTLEGPQATAARTQQQLVQRALRMQNEGANMPAGTLESFESRLEGIFSSQLSIFEGRLRELVDTAVQELDNRIDSLLSRKLGALISNKKGREPQERTP